MIEPERAARGIAPNKAGPFQCSRCFAMFALFPTQVQWNPTGAAYWSEEHAMRIATCGIETCRFTPAMTISPSTLPRPRTRARRPTGPSVSPGPSHTLLHPCLPPLVFFHSKNVWCSAPAQAPGRRRGELAMLNGEIMERYRLAKDWRSAGFYETENHRQIPHAVHTQFTPGSVPGV